MRVTHNRRWNRITLHLSWLPDRKRHTAENKTGGLDPWKCYKWTWTTHVKYSREQKQLTADVD